jgi:hypothetical protein
MPNNSLVRTQKSCAAQFKIGYMRIKEEIEEIARNSI